MWRECFWCTLYTSFCRVLIGWRTKRPALRVVVGNQLQCMLGKKQRMLTVQAAGSIPMFRKNGTGIVLNWPEGSSVARWNFILSDADVWRQACYRRRDYCLQSVIVTWKPANKTSWQNFVDTCDHVLNAYNKEEATIWDGGDKISCRNGRTALCDEYVRILLQFLSQILVMLLYEAGNWH